MPGALALGRLGKRIKCSMSSLAIYSKSEGSVDYTGDPFSKKSRTENLMLFNFNEE